MLAIGERAKARRLELGLTLKAVATAMDRTYQCIYGMEQEGAGNIRLIAQWAECLKMNPVALAFGWNPNETMRKEKEHSRVLLREALELLDTRFGKRKALAARIRKELQA